MGLRAQIAKEPWCKWRALHWLKKNPKATHGDLAVLAKWPRSTAVRFRKQAMDEGLLGTESGTPAEVQGTLVVVDTSPPSLRANGTPPGTPKQGWHLAEKEVREKYPKRNGSQRWRDAGRAYNARLKEHTHEVMMDGLTRYAEHCDAKGKTGTEYVMQAATFFGPNLCFTEEFDAKPERGNKNPMSLGTLR